MKKIVLVMILGLCFSIFVGCENANTESDVMSSDSVVSETSEAQSSEEQTVESETESSDSSVSDTSSEVSSVESIISSLGSKTETSSKKTESYTSTVSNVSEISDVKAHDETDMKGATDPTQEKDTTNNGSEKKEETYKETKPLNPPDMPTASESKAPLENATSKKPSPGKKPSGTDSKIQENDKGIVKVPTDSITAPIKPEIPMPDTGVAEPDASVTNHKGYNDKVNYGYTYDSSKSQKHNWLALEEKYYYSLLNGSEKEIYKKLDRAVRNLESEVKIGTNTDFDQISKVFEYYEYDNPECFYFQYRGGAYYEINGEFSAKIHYNFGEIKDFPQDFEGLSDQQKTKLRERISKFNKAVEDIVSTIPANAPAVVKEVLIYDRLLVNTKYNLTAAESAETAHQDNFTPYGALVNKTGVCESYSESFQLLCNAVGINCTLKFGENHQWNAVKLDGEWYECDVTFDDPINIEDGIVYGHTFFNRTTDFMVMHHPEVTAHLTPNCSATKYDFLKYFNK